MFRAGDGQARGTKTPSSIFFQVTNNDDNSNPHPVIIDRTFGQRSFMDQTRTLSERGLTFEDVLLLFHTINLLNYL
jgi:hypothetical protein